VKRNGINIRQYTARLNRAFCFRGFDFFRLLLLIWAQKYFDKGILEMKQLMIIFVVLGLVFFASNAWAELNVKEVQKRLPPHIFKEVSKIPDKPHFLLGFERKTDPWEQFQESRRLFHTREFTHEFTGSAWIDKSQQDYIVPGSNVLSQVLKVSGKELRIIYSHHHYTKDGMYIFWSKMGEKNLAEFSLLYDKYKTQWGLGRITDSQWRDIQRILGWAQYEALKSFLRDVVTWAVDKNVRDYQEMRLTEMVIAARSKLLDDPEYAKKLDEPVPGAPNLKIRDLMPVPMTRPEDFLPDLIVVGQGEFTGGFANFNTVGTERIVFFDTLGLALWYVRGWPMPAHEFIHANPYLQGMPIAFYYDTEMWADLTTGMQDDVLEFLFHPYLAVVRDLVKNFFGYDSNEVERRIWPAKFGHIQDIREDEFRKHAAEVKKITDELLNFIKDPKDGLMVKFYTDPYYWVVVNTKYCDTAAVYRILCALHYEPAGLFDPEKKNKQGKVIPPEMQTREWLEKEESAGRIAKLAELSMKQTGAKTKFAEDMGPEMSAMVKCPQDSRWFFLTLPEQQKFKEIVKPLAERAKNGDIEAKQILLRIFGRSSVFSLPVK